MNKRERLLKLIRERALSMAPITLRSGRKSNYYIDCRLITLSPEGATLTAEILFDALKEKEIDALGGLSIGADPICGAFSVISYQKGKPIPTFIIRKKQKEHGKQKLIEGPLKNGAKVVIVDDVATTGSSLLKAIDVVEDYGCKVLEVIVLVDRLEGAREKLTKRGYELKSIFTREDVLKNEQKSS
ncbi:MAG TPA: orotate phosphoribosyltransferase [Candidatus Altiarchaeales archaeon]|nr:orotate phosphoribosyltransferase [Candidatus Altiarchaeales archaeon]